MGRPEWLQGSTEEEQILRAAEDDGFVVLERRVRRMRTMAWAWTGTAAAISAAFLWLAAGLGGPGGLGGTGVAVALMWWLLPIVKWNEYDLMRRRLAAARVVRHVRAQSLPAPALLLTRAA